MGQAKLRGTPEIRQAEGELKRLARNAEEALVRLKQEQQQQVFLNSLTPEQKKERNNRLVVMAAAMAMSLPKR
jgi:hypothetical protein